MPLDEDVTGSVLLTGYSPVFVSEEEQLFRYLFRRYNNRIRPVRNSSDPVNVALTFSLMQIHHLELGYSWCRSVRWTCTELAKHFCCHDNASGHEHWNASFTSILLLVAKDERVQVFKTYGWLIVEWIDERLSWNRENFNNLTQFVVDSPLIWTPELALINAVEYQFPDFSKYRAIISSTGQVRWEPAGMFETSCKIDITFYPYDTQECDVIFGTWSYTSFMVNLTNSSQFVNLDDYNKSGEWNILSTRVDRYEFSYSCCPQMRFSKVASTISLIRRHRFFTLNLILPCAMLSSLTLVTFLSPPDQGEKISLGISILLSFSVFMLSMSENMPKTSETLPLFVDIVVLFEYLLCALRSRIGKTAHEHHSTSSSSSMLPVTPGVYTTFVMLMNTWSVMLTVLVLNLHHRNECRPIPGWLRLLAFEGLARLLCMYTEQHVIVYQHRIQQRRKSSASAMTGGEHGGGGNGSGNGGESSYNHFKPRQSLHQINEYWKQAEYQMSGRKSANKRRFTPFGNHTRKRHRTNDVSSGDTELKTEFSRPISAPSSPIEPPCETEVASKEINDFHRLFVPKVPSPQTPSNRPFSHFRSTAAARNDSSRNAALSAVTCSGLLAAATTSSGRLFESSNAGHGVRVTFVEDLVTMSNPPPSVESGRWGLGVGKRYQRNETKRVNLKPPVDVEKGSDEDDVSPDEPHHDEIIEPDEVMINLELQEWKRLARIMDRLFFWLTLTTLISVSIVLACLLIWR